MKCCISKQEGAGFKSMSPMGPSFSFCVAPTVQRQAWNQPTNKFFTAEKSKAHTVFLYQCFLKAIANETLVLPIMLDMSILSGGKLLVGFLVRPWLAVWWCHTHCGFFPGSVFGSGILYSVGWFYRWGVLLSGFTGCGSKVWRLKEFLKS